MSISLLNIFRRKVPGWKKDIIEQTRQYTMVSSDNILAVINNIQHVVTKNIEGDIIECGVWKGGCMMAAALTLRHLNSTNRKIYLYDTYSGFPDPGIDDVNHEGVPGKEILKNLAPAGKPWQAPGIPEVRSAMQLTGYPMENLLFIQGDVEETIPGTMSGKIAPAATQGSTETSFHQPTSSTSRSRSPVRKVT